MPENGIRSTYSQSPFQILMYDNDGLISTGTAFFYSYNDENFLITNWHNISGRHFITKELLGKRRPTYIKAKLATDFIGSDFMTMAHQIEIYKDYEPLWYEHPNLGSLCDIIAIPLEKPFGIAENMHTPSNAISKLRIPIKPGNSCFVIGFPKSLSIGFGLPLWKSGYIASEPHYDVSINGEISEIGGLQNGLALPAIFLDTLTREGMSGSPVFASYVGNWDSTNPYQNINPDDHDFWQRNDILLGENRMEFIGCYSGRIGKLEEGAAFGLCWKESVIKFICSKKVIGMHPHVG